MLYTTYNLILFLINKFQDTPEPNLADQTLHRTEIEITRELELIRSYIQQ